MALKYTGPADATNACNECGGPTYTFQSGSVWCPDEIHPGGHFVVRVAFERSPLKPAATPRSRANTSASEAARRIEERLSDKKAAVLNEEFAGGYHSFVKSEE